MLKAGLIVFLMLFAYGGAGNAGGLSREQVFKSVLAYGRSPQNARDAAAEIKTILGIQIYLTLSTHDYYVPHSQAMKSVRRIQTYRSFQIYLSLRTPSYALSHSQALRAALTLTSDRSFQLYLHLLVLGYVPEEALEIAKGY